MNKMVSDSSLIWSAKRIRNIFLWSKLWSRLIICKGICGFFLFTIQQRLLFKLTVYFVGVGAMATNVKSDHVFWASAKKEQWQLLSICVMLPALSSQYNFTVLAAVYFSICSIGKDLKSLFLKKKKVLIFLSLSIFCIFFNSASDVPHRTFLILRLGILTFPK